MSERITLPGGDYDKVKSGQKTMIVRTPSSRLNVRVNDWVPMRFSGRDDHVVVEISGIEWVRFSELSDKIACKCGFNNLRDLKRCLLDKFVTLDNGSMLYLYGFEVMGVCEKVK
ncbi:MAG: ASCH domain-containing protein [Methanobrevibacter sp.]|uniref:hypothetical protein n=1 Tax=Methanobrevibacter sp. TaxID=66852 RepID=UPI0025EEE73A|nr:hypothetical protein [Methanobrevibacter sp.]MBR0272397.1 ASCH domain-containing protein [Methanobrevibacter sp.]